MISPLRIGSGKARERPTSPKKRPSMPFNKYSQYMNFRTAAYYIAGKWKSTAVVSGIGFARMMISVRGIFTKEPLDGHTVAMNWILIANIWDSDSTMTLTWLGCGVALSCSYLQRSRGCLWMAPSNTLVVESEISVNNLHKLEGKWKVVTREGISETEKQAYENIIKTVTTQPIREIDDLPIPSTWAEITALKILFKNDFLLSRHAAVAQELFARVEIL
ncbi:hypothetical protein EDB82DRAFT_473698 [Fusarium venenatum]|uniref:uncharacterized protein n=1 Tax=Fusarium venenatum TaxID=56646 RepID=UPI001DA28B18|nr:hypothetical protein EDB82DRAFT_473698 [Fusarium venenatum]